MDSSKIKENFFHDQYVEIKKEIQKFNFNYFQSNNESFKFKKEPKKSMSVNFLVIGPQKSGKSSLLKTMHYALNDWKKLNLTSEQHSNFRLKKFSIIKSQKYKISGLGKFKQTEQKLSVTGFQLQSKQSEVAQKQLSQQKYSRYIKKYSQVLKLIISNESLRCCANMKFQLKPFGRIMESTSINIASDLNNIQQILLVFNILKQVDKQQLYCIQNFFHELQERGISFIVILTHIDQLDSMPLSHRLSFIEEKITDLTRQLNIKNRNVFVCIQNLEDMHQKLYQNYENQRQVSVRKKFSFSQSEMIFSRQKKRHQEPTFFTKTNDNQSNLFQKYHPPQVSHSNLQQVKYHALKLLLKIIKKNYKIVSFGQKQYFSFFKWLCG